MKLTCSRTSPVTAKLRGSKDIQLSNIEESNNNRKQAYIPASRSAVIDPDHSETLNEQFEGDVQEPNDKIHQEMKLVRKALLLSIAYSSNIGGTATLTGTGTNLVFEEIFHEKFKNSHEVTFTSWFLYAFPAAAVTLVLAWALLYAFYLMKQ